MRRFASRTPEAMYAKLLLIYPAAYRRQYAKAMTQTFSDMLAAAPTKRGRAAIWARALWDVPASAVQQYTTNGKEVHVHRNTKIAVVGVILLLVVANAASFWFGSLHAREQNAVMHVTPAQLADAMQEDDFYSTYGGAALLFTGVVSNVAPKDGMTLVTFQTNRPYAVSCQFPAGASIRLSQTLAVAAPGGSADRLPHGVQLHHCTEQ